MTVNKTALHPGWCQHIIAKVEHKLSAGPYPGAYREWVSISLKHNHIKIYNNMFIVNIAAAYVTLHNHDQGEERSRHPSETCHRTIDFPTPRKLRRTIDATHYQFSILQVSRLSKGDLHMGLFIRMKSNHTILEKHNRAILNINLSNNFF